MLHIQNDIRDVLVVGCGKGLAELALAVEFPMVNFYLTDIENETTPNWLFAMQAVRSWSMKNVNFLTMNILDPPVIEADFVCSTEVLEHIENSTDAALNMYRTAHKYVYCLVPFADQETNQDTKRRKRALLRHGHYVCGFDAEELISIFPNPLKVRGCYWAEFGARFRSSLDDMDVAQIKLMRNSLIREAKCDIVCGRVPQTTSEAQGIWILSRVR